MILISTAAAAASKHQRTVSACRKTASPRAAAGLRRRQWTTHWPPRRARHPHLRTQCPPAAAPRPAEAGRAPACCRRSSCPAAGATGPFMSLHICLIRNTGAPAQHSASPRCSAAAQGRAPAWCLPPLPSRRCGFPGLVQHNRSCGGWRAPCMCHSAGLEARVSTMSRRMPARMPACRRIFAVLS